MGFYHLKSVIVINVGFDQKRGVEKISCHNCFCSPKIEKNLFLKC
jgi:hypothetical protein